MDIRFLEVGMVQHYYAFLGKGKIYVARRENVIKRTKIVHLNTRRYTCDYFKVIINYTSYHINGEIIVSPHKEFCK